jgi:hypothetical protein
MQARSASAVLLALGLAGCAEPAPTAPVQGAARLARATAASRTTKTRPLSGRCVTTFAPIPRPLPAVYRQVATGTCHLAHLGRTTLLLVQDINFAAGTQTSVTVTYTAANGDILRAVNTGTSTRIGTGVAFSATVTFVGGTGRFAHATGEARAVGTADFVANTSDYTLDGWLAYDAADRSGS